MKKIVLTTMAVILLGCASQEVMRVRQMPIQNINLNNVVDGEYVGAFAYSGFEYKVKTTVSAHRIAAIEILQNRNTRHARKAEGVLGKIVQHQTPNVDAVSGATTTSKAIMKAVENSLTGKPSL